MYIHESDELTSSTVSNKLKFNLQHNEDYLKNQNTTIYNKPNVCAAIRISFFFFFFNFVSSFSCVYFKDKVILRAQHNSQLRK